MNNNPMPAMVVWEAYSREKTLSNAVLIAAVHGWYEGRVDAHVKYGVSVEVRPLAPGEQPPIPPYPNTHNKSLEKIIHQAVELFEADEMFAAPASAYAAGLSWKAGFEEGRSCKGCWAPGSDPEMARSVRLGITKITLT